jgi:glycosyltransferase involved in cell wall biosynthesis
LIGDAIGSVLNQSFKDLEVIVIDDGSTDNTEQVVYQFCGPIKYVRQANAGRSVARNHGIKLAEGEYIALLDSDDLFEPQKLEQQVALLDSSDDLGFVYTGFEFIDLSGRTLEKSRLYTLNPPRRGKIFKHLLYFAFISLSTVVARRECFRAAGLFEPTRHQAEDYDWLLRMARLYETDFVPESLCLIRLHENNTPAAFTAEATVQVLTKHLALPDAKKELGKDWPLVCRDRFLSVARYYYEQGNMKRAREYLMRSRNSTSYVI